MFIPELDQQWHVYTRMLIYYMRNSTIDVRGEGQLHMLFALKIVTEATFICDTCYLS